MYLIHQLFPKGNGIFYLKYNNYDNYQNLKVVIQRDTPKISKRR